MIRLRQIVYFFRDLGMQPTSLVRAVIRIPRFLRDRRQFRRLWKAAGKPLAWGTSRPLLLDRDDQAGTVKGAYFHQDLLVARRIFERRPARHVDVGSRIDGFVAHVAVFMPIEIIDRRPLPSSIQGMTFLQADLLDEIPPHLRQCTSSLSCLHAVEHMGLGRYGDELDPHGDTVAIGHLSEMLAPGGTLYLSAPMGPSRIEFNAHRVFSIADLSRMLEPLFRIERFSYIDDAGDLHDNRSWSDDAARNNYGCTYGCAIFEAKRC
jgi:hypothetical protein